MSTSPDPTLQFTLDAARIASELHVADVVVLDLRGLTSLADFFVIGTGTSDRQMHAVVHELKMHAKTIERTPLRVSDSGSSSWILADYVDVVVHLFDPTHREYYDLEGLWGHAPTLDWQAALGRTPESAE